MFTIRCNLDRQFLVRRFEVTGPVGYLLTASADGHAAQQVVDHISSACSHCDCTGILVAINDALKNNVAIYRAR